MRVILSYFFCNSVFAEDEVAFEARVKDNMESSPDVKSKLLVLAEVWFLEDRVWFVCSVSPIYWCQLLIVL